VRSTLGNVESEGPIDGERIYRCLAAFALAIGIGALLAPRLLLRLYGVPAGDLTGSGQIGWRLFAVRQIWIAAAAFAGDRRARDAVLAIQAPDLVIFALAYRTRSIPRVAAVLALLSAAGVAALSALARSRTPGERGTRTAPEAGEP
jgi:hypothetical protein